MIKQYHRLQYEEREDLSEKFKVNTITCGFLREPKYNTESNTIKGFCYFRERLRLETTCTKHLPFKVDGCKVFETYNNREGGKK